MYNINNHSIQVDHPGYKSNRIFVFITILHIVYMRIIYSALQGLKHDLGYLLTLVMGDMEERPFSPDDTSPINYTVLCQVELHTKFPTFIPKDNAQKE